MIKQAIEIALVNAKLGRYEHWVTVKSGLSKQQARFLASLLRNMGFRAMSNNSHGGYRVEVLT